MKRSFFKYTANGERDESMNYGRVGNEEPELGGPLPLVVNSEFHDLDGELVIYDDDEWYCPQHDEGRTCPGCDDEALDDQEQEELCGGYRTAIVLHSEGVYLIGYEDLRDLDEDELALYQLSNL